MGAEMSRRGDMSRPATVLERSPGAAGPLLAEDDRWWHRAACEGADLRIFFPGPKEPPERIAEARAYCARCPVRSACLADAEKTRDADAVRGGMTPAERRAARPPSPWCGTGRHRRTPENTSPAGACRECRRENQARNRPPAGPGSGNSGVLPDRDGSGHFVKAPHRTQKELVA
jgi:WhiB family redox-sensing transcriptional regulator